LKDFFFVFVGRNFGDSYFSLFLEKLKTLNNAIYLGPMYHHRTLMNILRCSGILVSTSISENFGYAIAEALAMGKPVVWFDSGGPRDFLDSRNSVLVESRDPSSLAEGILKCYERIKKGEFRGREIRERIYGKYSYDKILKRYLEFLDLADLQGDQGE
jgi:glycosyltransferase involved in cell wall biosynthesis